MRVVLKASKRILLNSSVIRDKETRVTEGWLPTVKGCKNQDPGGAGSGQRPLKVCGGSGRWNSYSSSLLTLKLGSSLTWLSDSALGHPWGCSSWPCLLVAFLGNVKIDWFQVRYIGPDPQGAKDTKVMSKELSVHPEDAPTGQRPAEPS